MGTSIVGNYIGLDASGAATTPNVEDDIRIGSAVRTTIGGPRASEANLFAGGETAVSAGPSANNLVVRGNSIGIDAEGANLVPPRAGVVVNSEGLVGQATEATITANEIRLEGGVGIAQTGFAGWISGNWIFGADTGIQVDGAGEEGRGNLIQGNAIEGSSVNGILVESDSNEILGNEVSDSGGAGILLEGAHSPFGFGVSGNLVGGNAEADENFIVGSAGAAIEISNLEKTNNEVARNRGLANAGLFIDLVGAAPATEKKGPNKGIEPPTFATVTRFEASGSGVEAGARIRVFRKASAEAGEIESFLGEAIADEEGSWHVVYDAPIPAATIVAATQTIAGTGTSELAVATTPSEELGSGSGPAPSCAPGGCGGAQPVPETKIFKGPKGKRFAMATTAFKFNASVDDSTFQCKLDRGPFRDCHSPQVYTGLKPGRHRFEVRAVSSAGAVDASPAKLKFTVRG